MFGVRSKTIFKPWASLRLLYHHCPEHSQQLNVGQVMSIFPLHPFDEWRSTDCSNVHGPAAFAELHRWVIEYTCPYHLHPEESLRVRPSRKAEMELQTWRAKHRKGIDGLRQCRLPLSFYKSSVLESTGLALDLECIRKCPASVLEFLSKSSKSSSPSSRRLGMINGQGRVD